MQFALVVWIGTHNWTACTVVGFKDAIFAFSNAATFRAIGLPTLLRT